MENRKDNSPHILNSSSTLLGLCFIVLTSLKVTSRTEKSIIDELTAVASVMFMTSSILSFLSMRSIKTPKIQYEKNADYIFLAGLLFLFITTMLLIFNIIK